MTAIWGPLGWMTLHSTAFAYPENPTPTEQALMSTWLDMFRDTITCPSCQGHFSNLLASYRAQFRDMLVNRQQFVLFTFRAHNAVNRGLNKPIYASVEECMVTLRDNVATRSAKEYRNAYWTHIARHWQTFQDITGIVALKKIRELRRIEEEYVTPRDTNFKITIPPGVVVLPQTIMERTAYSEPPSRPVLPRGGGAAGFRIAGGGIRLRM